MSNDYNPYAVPNAAQGMGGMGVPGYPPQQRLADLGKRFLGSLVDGFSGLVFAGPGVVISIIGLGVIFLGLIALIVLQIYLLATRSQSIGKFVMKTQMVDVNTGQPASFVNTFLLRGVVNGLIGGIPFVGPIYTLVDILFIFREDHRCIHDLLASTVVIDISA
jgi:uncharacterized RDD family membrane protein YckC